MTPLGEDKIGRATGRSTTKIVGTRQRRLQRGACPYPCLPVLPYSLVKTRAHAKAAIMTANRIE